MIAFISRNTWTSPTSAFSLYFQKRKLREISSYHKGYRGLRVKWTLRGVYFMTLWKEESDLNTFLSNEQVQNIFKSRINKVDVTTLRMSAINFIPWIEVVSLMDRNSVPVTNVKSLVS